MSFCASHNIGSRKCFPRHLKDCFITSKSCKYAVSSDCGLLNDSSRENRTLELSFVRPQPSEEVHSGKTKCKLETFITFSTPSILCKRGYADLVLPLMESKED